jgi:Ca2+-binding RTX toxin-like protein
MTTISGTPNADTLNGTSGPDRIQGLEGDDYLYGDAGDDLLEGGPGDDHLDGGDGTDELHGGDGNDSFYNTSSGSTLPENDRFYGEGGNDNLHLYITTSVAETVVLDGGEGDDRITFEAWYYTHNVTLLGGDGDDTIFAVGGHTLSIDAGAGNDTVSFNFADGMDVTLTLGAGADFVDVRRDRFTSNGVQSAIHVTDFDAAPGGDRLSFDTFLGLLSGWDARSNPFATGHLAIEQRGSDAVLKIDLDGGGDGYRDFVVFEGVAASALGLANIGFATDGTYGPGLSLDGDGAGNQLNGSGHDDIIHGLDGDDTILGYAGDDVLEGGLGNDTIDGSWGNDRLYGQDGDDTLTDVNSGDDALYGGDGNDQLTVERSSTVSHSTVLLDGGAGNDTLRYAPANAVPYRGPLDDVTMLGGDGNDYVYVNAARTALIDVGAGNDTVSISNQGTAFTISLGSGVDTLHLESTRAAPGAIVVTDFEPGAAGDILEIDGYLRQQLAGWDPTTHPFEQGYMRLVQRGADAVLQIDRDGPSGAAAFTDLIVFQNADASAFVGRNLGGYSIIVGTDGDDRLEGTDGIDIIRGLGGNDVLLGGGRSDTLEGGPGDDTLDGGSGYYADKLDGGLGADNMTGGDGDDVYIVDSAGDQVFEYHAPFGTDDSRDEVRTSLAAYTLPAEVERLIGTSDAGQTLTGNARDNFVGAGAGNDVIYLLGGNNQASAGAGDDRIEGGDGSDFIQSGPGHDTVLGGSGNDTLYGGYDLADAGTGGDHIEGGAGDDRIQDSYGDDVLLGGDGNDLIEVAGGGADHVEGGEGDDYISLSASYAMPAATVTLLAGAGNDTAAILIPNSGTAVVDMGAGDDLVSIYQTNATINLTLGAGADTISFPGQFHSYDPGMKLIVTDFTTGAGGDRLALETFLSFSTNWDGVSNPFATGYLRLVQSGTSTLLQLDVDGGGDGFVTWITFQGADASQFTAANLGGFESPEVFGTDGSDTIRGSAGPDRILAGSGNDFLYLQDGGNDTASGGGGNDFFIYGASLIAADSNDGGAGSDAVLLQGDYSGGVTLGAGALVNVEGLLFASGSDTRFGDAGGHSYSYNVTTIDANVAAGQKLTVTASLLLAGENFTFNGSAETDGTFLVYGGKGRDDVTGGHGNDLFFFAEGRWNAGDHVDGGAGYDGMILRGPYMGGNAITFGANDLHSVEAIGLNSVADFRFDPGIGTFGYDLTLSEGNVGETGNLLITGFQLSASEAMRVDGHAIQTGTLSLYGGAGADSLIGGANGDLLRGNGGADTLTGGSGADTFQYFAAGDSTVAASDHILDFTNGTDRIDLLRVDADTTQAGDQAFSFIDGNAFSGHAGELRTAYDAGSGHWFVQGDTDGDGQADFQILVDVTGQNVHFAATDFIL